jgi:hypothetical protein
VFQEQTAIPSSLFLFLHNLMCLLHKNGYPNLGSLKLVKIGVRTLKNAFLITQVLISARENYNSELPPAIVALLKVHDRAVLGGHDDEDLQGRAPPPAPETATAKLLIPQVQAGTLIGKGGQTIKAMQEQTRASIKVLQENEFVKGGLA